ncbi:MAG: hypothetical protein SH819_00835 [Cytophagales bacterium]|nr:hypothetical protein [Cytophagales bacterium]
MKKKTSESKAKKQKRKPRVHKKLSGLEVKIDSFGEIKSTMNIEKINEFLDEHVEDKKLIEQKEHAEKKKKRDQKK